MNPYSIPPLITSILALFLGFLTLVSKNPRVRLTFPFVALAVFTWLFGYSVVYSTLDYHKALFWARLLYAGVIFIPAFSYHFITSFLRIKGQKLILFIIYIITLCFLFLTRTEYFIAGLYKYFWGYQTKIGPLHNLFLLFFFIVMARAIFLIFTSYHRAKKEHLFLEVNRIKYILISYFVSFFAAIDFLPNYGFQFYPLGFIFIAFHAIMSTYAIVTHRALDINIALTRGAIFILVYGLVLTIPILLGIYGSFIFVNFLGNNWWAVPLIIGMALASAGPFIYLFLQRRAEKILRKEQLIYQEELRDISSTMMLIKELDRLLKTIVLRIVDIVKVSWAGIYLKDEKESKYILKHQRARTGEINLPGEFSFDSALVNHFYQARLPLIGEEIYPHTQESPAFQSGDEVGYKKSSSRKSRSSERGAEVYSSELKVGLAVPCFIEDSLLGFLILGDKPKGQLYDESDVNTFTFLSNQTALAIENCQFYSQERQRQHYRRIATLDRQMDCMAHEIDNPIQGLLGIIFSLDMTFDELKDNIPPDKMEYLKNKLSRATFNAKRISKMIEAVKEFSKPSTGELSLVSLANIVESFNYITGPQFKHHNVNFTQELPPETIWLRANKVELEQVLVNLSTNSIQAIIEAPKENKREVVLKAYKKDADTLRIDFSDTGSGVEEKLLEDIFLDFVTTKASSIGTGLGLSISRKIIQRHKGRIWAESEGQNRGATFHIELPIAKDITEEEIRKLEQEEREKEKRIMF